MISVKQKYLQMKRKYLELKKQLKLKGGNGLLVKCPYCQAVNDNQYPYESLPPKQKYKQCGCYFTQDEAIKVL